MFKSRIFWKIYLNFILFTILTGLVIGIFISYKIRQDELHQTEQKLTAYARLFNDVSPNRLRENSSALRQQVDDVNKKLGVRLTVIRSDGVVLADSDEDFSKMENHADRPELIQAGEKGSGTATRFSKTLQKNMMYVALPIVSEGKVVAYSRAAFPLSDIYQRIAELSNIGILAIGIGALLALLFGLFLARQIVSPLTRMTELADSLADGDFEKRVSVSGKNEFGKLANALNTMAAHIMQGISRREEAEAEVRKSEQYQNLFQLANDAILIIKPEDETVLDINDKACKMYGFSRDEFIGISMKSISQDMESGDEQIQKLFAEGAYQEFESVQYRTDGTPINLLINASLIEFQSEQAILSINRDITARKQIENDLRENERHLLSVTNSAQDAIVSADNRGNIIFWNEGARKIFGYDKQEVIGKSLSTLMPERYRKSHAEGMRRHLETGEKHVIGQTVELHGLKKDGTEFPLELSLGTWERAEGKYFTGIMRDITERRLSRESLEESERRYRFLGEGIMHQVWTALPDGKLDYVNRRTLEYFGFTMEQAIHDGWMNVVHPEDLPKCVEKWTHSLETGADYEVEFRLKRADGEYLWHLGRATAGRDAEGKIFKWFGTNSDIHTQKSAEKALEESEEKFRSIVETTNDWIWETDLDGNSIYNNPAVETILGYTPEDFYGKSLLSFVHEGDRVETEQALTRFIAEKRGWTNLVSRCCRKDGSIRYLESSAVPVFNEDGEVVGFRGMNHDITERKKTEKALLRSQSAVDATQDGVFMFAPNTLKFFYVNEGAVAQVGYSQAELLQMTPLDIKPEFTEESFRRTVAPLIAGTLDSHFFTTVHRHKDGTDIPVEIILQYVISEDGENLFVAMVRDITDRRRAENALRESEERFRRFMNNNPAVAFLKDEAGKYVYVNETMERIFNLEMKELVGKTDYDWLPEEVARDVSENDRKVLDADKTVELLETVPFPNGSERKWLTFKFPVTDSLDNKFVGGTAIDITDRERDKIALAESEYKLRTLIENMSEGLIQVDKNEVIIFVNNRFCEMIGYEREELLGKTTFDILLDEEGRKFVREANRKRQKGVSNQYELRLKTKTGKTLWVIVGGVPIFNADEKFSGTMGVVTDITERKRTEEQLLHDAFHDGLTGLANRALFMDHLRMTIERGKNRQSNLYAVLFLDFDRFKIINDSLGHTEGDKLLKHIAKRLQSAVRTGDLVARLGGDEFVILLSELVEANEALLIAERIQNDLRTAFEVSGREIFISVSIGITLSSAGHENAEDMLRDADIAMYRAKEEGRANYKVFDQTMHEQASKQLQLETEMRQALEREEYELHYQPIINLKTESLIGFESLIRWKHPTRGMIPPFEFIPAAEENGLILPLGQWITRESCRQLREWQNKIPSASDLTISVNLSGKEFLQPDLAEQIAGTLEKTGLDPHCLKLEITESHVMENSEKAITMLNRLRQIGVRLSLDDFGTGYSSLSYLHRLPVKFLKIDRSFVMRMADSEENHEIVRTIIKLTHNLKMKVIAEGIETADQLARLKHLNCEYGQGYFFSKPLEAKKAKIYIEESVKNLIPTNGQPIINVETNM